MNTISRSLQQPEQPSAGNTVAGFGGLLYGMQEVLLRFSHNSNTRRVPPLRVFFTWRFNIHIIQMNFLRLRRSRKRLEEMRSQCRKALIPGALDVDGFSEGNAVVDVRSARTVASR